MAQEFSFDLSLGFDRQEFSNAIDQTRREVNQRYDFKNVLAKIEENDKQLTLQTESDYKMIALIDILESKLIKRGLPITILDKSSAPEQASGGTVRKCIKLIDSMSSEQAKEIAKRIRTDYPKVKPVIQGDSIRISSKSKDELQSVIVFLKQTFADLPLQFINYR